MNPILKNILAVVGGWLVGSTVNMAIIMIGPMIIPLPEGVDPSNMESLAANMVSFGPKHFISPFLAHALGTFVGALVAINIAANRKALFGYVIGGLFLLGGIANVFMLPSPMWFNVLDIVGAYLPMAWLAIRISKV